MSTPRASLRIAAVAISLPLSLALLTACAPGQQTASPTATGRSGTPAATTGSGGVMTGQAGATTPR